MQLSELSHAYDSDRPFLTAYLEPEPPDFESDRSVELRWRALAEELSEAGADEATITAVEDVLTGEPAGQLARTGRVVVASNGSVLLSEPLAGPVGGDHASWSAVPDLGPYVRANGGSRRQVMAVIDRVGADVYVRDVTGLRHEQLTGETWPVHRVRGAGWDQWRVQSGIEETIDRNAEMVTQELVRRIGLIKPSVVLLAGDVEARESVHNRMPDHLSHLVAVTDRGSRNEVDRGALEEALEEAAWQAERRHQRDLLEKFGTREAHQLGVQGLDAVCRAFRLSAVETLIFAVENPDSGAVADVLRGTLASGPEANQLAVSVEELRREVVDTGADPGHHIHITEELADAVLVRAGALTGASLEVVTAAAAGLADGVGALLRFELPAL